MDKTWWRITQVIFVPLIVAILFTAVREIVLEVSGDATVTTNGIRIYNEPFTYTNDVIYMSNGIVLFRTNFPRSMLRLNPEWVKWDREHPNDYNTNLHWLYEEQSLYVTNSPTFSAHDLIFKAKSNGELTNLVNELVTSGEFCRIRAHKWGFSERAATWALSSMTPHEYRECSVCGKIEERSMPAWPTP